MVAHAQTAPAHVAPHYIVIGRIIGPHGIRGGVKVSVLTDYPERFRPGTPVYLGSEEEAAPVEIVAVRPHKNMLLILLADVPDRNAAELLRDRLFLIPEAQAMPLGEHENYAHDLIDLAVETVEGEALGRLTEILFTGANDVYVVVGPEGELLLPALREVVLQVDLAAGRMVVALPDGLRD